MKRTIKIAIIFIFLFKALAFAEISIKAQVDKKILTTDEDITYKLIISSAEKNLPQPQIPKFEGFDVISSAQSSNMSFIKGGVKTTLVYVFILAPVDTGKLKIEPSTIKIKNTLYSTDAFEIQVRQGEIKPKAKPQTPSLPFKSHPEKESEQPQITL